jgi:hypothetical protein
MRTIFRGILKHENKYYLIEDDFGYGYPGSAAEFMWMDGNRSCDCNRSIWIHKQCDKTFSEMDCGDKIELVWHVVLGGHED